MVAYLLPCECYAKLAHMEDILTRCVDEVIGKEDLEQKRASNKHLRVKLGIDPTSPNLHLGRAVPLLKLRDFQKQGHKVVFIVGDATGIIGDTSDKESERPMLSRKQVAENAKTYLTQAKLLLDIDDAEIHYNSEWLDRLTYKAIGEQADQFSVADFIARVSLREMLYPLMQGYDSVAVEADIELGGTDQRFNLLAGRALQSHYGQEPQAIITMDLIPGTDGRKMSSSWGNTINLTDAPREMYGKVMRVDDTVVETYFVACTRVPLDEVHAVLKEHPRDAKMRLAKEIVTLYHGGALAKQAEKAFVTAFQEKEVPDEVEHLAASAGDLLADVLVSRGVVQSKTEFRRLVDERAIKNAKTAERIIDAAYKIEKEIIVKVGKRRFVKIVVS